jgi:DNA-binding response OmpR family regulator
MRVLLVEDDPDTAESIALMLRSEKLVVDTTEFGEDGLEIGKLYDYDIILLDLMLPDIDGYEVLRRLRQARVATPILIVSGLGEMDNKIKGLGFGADDYLTKPFEFRELLARMRALLRRPAELAPAQIHVADLTLDTAAQAADRGGRGISLTHKEYALLEYLVRNVNRVVGRAEIAEHVWDEQFDPFSNLIEVYINRLRRKIDGPKETPLLHTRRGAGYLLGIVEQPEDAAESPPGTAGRAKSKPHAKRNDDV